MPRSFRLLQAAWWMILLLLLVPLAAGAQDAAPAPLTKASRTAIRKVVSSQLAAFQRDDGAEAFSYAAPEIQAQFRTPGNFMRMVREGYRVLYRPREIFFQPARVEDGQVVQPLLATGEDGNRVLALYFMQLQPGGAWRIGGVFLLSTKQQGV